MKEFNHSVLSRWRSNAEREWFLNGNSEADDRPHMMDVEAVRSSSATPHGVEESWIDLEHDKQRRTFPYNSIVGFVVDELDEAEGEDDEDAVVSGDEETSAVKRARFTRASQNSKTRQYAQPHIDLNTSLTTILATQRKYSFSDDDDDDDDDDGVLKRTSSAQDTSQVVFMDISNSSSMRSSTELSLKKGKKRRMNSSRGQQRELTQSIALISIIASISFSAGYALGHSRRHLY